jgi:alkyldihydroxyacetonephosphate synthase
MDRRRKHWGWGYEDQQPPAEGLQATARVVCERLGLALEEVEQPVGLEQLRLADPRVRIPDRLAAFSAADVHSRASHALGKSYCDVVLGFRGRFEHPPDFVARPRDEIELEGVLEWCSAEGVAAIPYGGGTSVVGGVTPAVGDRYNGAVSVDLGELDRVVEVDEVSCAALIEAGALGPSLEEQLRERDLTLRHFPQSFEYSTLGGWIATRAGGHFATLWTHIEDLVESVRAITPTGVWESRRLPGSGAGISPDRMLAGSEGVLAVITRAWVRVQRRPRHRSSRGVRFASFADGAEAVRAISQAGLHPANCRLLDGGETALMMGREAADSLLVLGFESVDSPVEDALERALAVCAEHGGRTTDGESSSGSRGGAGGDDERAGDGRAGADPVASWRESFLAMPYLRDVMVAAGVLAETFETAITWERFPALHERVTAAALEALPQSRRGGARVNCRFTHVYPDGPAPYFTVIAPARRGGEVEQWGRVKEAVSDAILHEGGTITHHHAVGRDHLPWYDRQRPDPFAAALRGAKAALDPAGVMNPGVLIEAPR